MFTTEAANGENRMSNNMEMVNKVSFKRKTDHLPTLKKAHKWKRWWQNGTCTVTTRSKTRAQGSEKKHQCWNVRAKFSFFLLYSFLSILG